jgi:hypothetical protein
MIETMAMLKMTFLLHYVTYKNPIFLSYLISLYTICILQHFNSLHTELLLIGLQSPFFLLIDLQCPWFSAQSPMPLTVMPQISRRPMSVLPPLSQPSPSLA